MWSFRKTGYILAICHEIVYNVTKRAFSAPPPETAEQERKDLTPMLTVSHLTKKYGKVTACDDLSFHLDPGSVTVLLGPNGAGKSTLMKAVIGFLRCTGEITVGGYPNKTPEARRLLGYIPEMPSL